MELRFTDLLAQLRKRFDRPEYVAEVEAYLAAEGFDRGQIGTILSAWLTGIRSGRQREAAVRIQGPHERGRFTLEAWGYLTGLRTAGRLDQEEMEYAIDRLLMHADGQVGVDDVRSLMESDGHGPFGDTTIVH